MRQLFVFAAFFFSAFSFAQRVTSYPGNGKNGFGGAVGQGSLSITETNDSVSFKLTRGPGLFDSLLVFYVDEKSTTSGISNTNNVLYQGTNNKYSVAASGTFSPAQKAPLTFPADFKPDLALVFDKDGGKIFFLADPGFGGSVLMQDQGSFDIMPSGTNSSPTYTQQISKTAIGLQSNDTLNFKFFGTYIGQTASRSNEGFGDPMDGYVSRTAGYNAYTVKSYFTYSTSLANTLPVKITDFKAVKEKDNVLVKWSVADEINIEAYNIQRSTNGINFNTISTLKARNTTNATDYSFSDNAAAKGINYYRLAVVEKGAVEYSKIVSIRNSVDKNSFTVIPRGRSLSIKLSGIDAGTYKLTLMNTSGQLLQIVTFQHDGSEAQKDIELKDGLTRGVFRVTLHGENAQFIKSILIH